MTPTTAALNDVNNRLAVLDAQQLAAVARSAAGLEFVHSTDPAAAAVFAALAALVTAVAADRQRLAPCVPGGAQ